MNFAGMEKRSFGLRVKFAIIVIGVGLIGLAALIHVSDYLTAKDFEGHIKERAFLVTEDILFHLHRGMVSGNHYGILNSLDSHLAAIKVVELRRMARKFPRMIRALAKPE